MSSNAKTKSTGFTHNPIPIKILAATRYPDDYFPSNPFK